MRTYICGYQANKEAYDYKNTRLSKKIQQQGGRYKNMTPNNTKSCTQATIQLITPGGSDNAMTNQGGSGTNQGTNKYNRRNTRGGNQNDRGDNQQSI